jgi:hypothetical protein
LPTGAYGAFDRRETDTVGTVTFPLTTSPGNAGGAKIRFTSVSGALAGKLWICYDGTGELGLDGTFAKIGCVDQLGVSYAADTAITTTEGMELSFEAVGATHVSFVRSGGTSAKVRLIASFGPFSHFVALLKSLTVDLAVGAGVIQDLEQILPATLYNQIGSAAARVALEVFEGTEAALGATANNGAATGFTADAGNTGCWLDLDTYHDNVVQFDVIGVSGTVDGIRVKIFRRVGPVAAASGANNSDTVELENLLFSTILTTAAQVQSARLPAGRYEVKIWAWDAAAANTCSIGCTVENYN